MSQAPVIIEPYDPLWPAKFELERKVIEEALATYLVGTVEHIGSTSVPGLWAKPVIDIMAGVASLAESRPAIPLIEAIGYWYFPYKPDQIHWFCKPSDRIRTHHLHLVPYLGEVWNSRLAFRDRLRVDSELRDAYAELKLSLAETFRDDREAYTEAKSEFIASALR